jgi:hypothetical protein
MKLIERLHSGEATEYCMQKRYIRGDGKTVHGDLRTRFVADEHGQMILGFSIVQESPERRAA